MKYARVRTYLWFLRARVSIPYLLAHGREGNVVSLFTAINGGFMILMMSALAWLWELPLLFPALGPTCFILYSAPLSRAAAPRSVVLGHFLAIGTGYAVWFMLGEITGKTISLQEGGGAVLCSASLALAGSAYLLMLTSCPHAPACASALIIALGGVESGWGALCMAFAVVLVVLQAVAVNRFASVPVPLWAPRKPVRA